LYGVVKDWNQNKTQDRSIGPWGNPRIGTGQKMMGGPEFLGLLKL
jgi:hypothetical protein